MEEMKAEEAMEMSKQEAESERERLIAIACRNLEREGISRAASIAIARDLWTDWEMQRFIGVGSR